MTANKQAVLFDLDGTLVDTAPDMVRVLAEMIAEHGATPLPYDTVRSWVSNGSLGLVRLGFPSADEATQSRLQAEYLERYASEVCRESRVFPALNGLLDAMDTAGRRWGIVTNKPTRMTEALLAGLDLTRRAACVVCGDTLPLRKPDPAPLLLGASQADVAPEDTLYVGDAQRDIEAGRNAGMTTVAAAYGYIVAGDSVDDWQADHVAEDPEALVELLTDAVGVAA